MHGKCGRPGIRDAMEFHQIIEAAVRLMDITRTELARRCRVPRTYTSRVGVSLLPGLDIVSRLAAVCDVPMWALTMGVDVFESVYLITRVDEESRREIILRIAEKVTVTNSVDTTSIVQ